MLPHTAEFRGQGGANRDRGAVADERDDVPGAEGSTASEGRLVGGRAEEHEEGAVDVQRQHVSDVEPRSFATAVAVWPVVQWFGGADGGLDRVVFGNRGGFGGGRGEVVSEVAEVASEVAEARCASRVARWTHRSGLPAVDPEPAAATGSGFSPWQGGDAGVAGTGATAACAGTGAECTAAAAPTTGRNQGRRQDLSDDGGKSLPDLFVSSDDESVCDGGEVGLDELLCSSEPVQPLRGASSTDGVRM